MERSREAGQWRRLRTLTALAAAMATVTVACSDGGGEAEPTTTRPPPSSTTTSTPITTAPESTTTTTTVPATTTAPAETTDPSTTGPTTTTEDDLKAQIAADYVRSWDLRNELTSNPTLDNLDARVAEIAAVGTPEFDSLKAFIEELVAIGERTAPSDPDYFAVTVERVDVGDGTDANVQICFVDNRRRLDVAGQPTGEFDELIAFRGDAHVKHTPSGWLPDGQLEISWRAIGVPSCPPA